MLTPLDIAADNREAASRLNHPARRVVRLVIGSLYSSVAFCLWHTLAAIRAGRRHYAIRRRGAVTGEKCSGRYTAQLQ